MKLISAISLVYLFSLTVMAQDEKTLVIAHRGASGYAPENTIAAIEKALDLKADVIEIDVHLSKDGEVVVIHDKTLDRTTNLKGKVKDHTLKQLKKADAGSWFNASFAGAKVPTLMEVLEVINGRAQLLIEIKEGGDEYPGIEEKILQQIKAKNAEDWCMVQSFSTVSVENFLQLKTQVPAYKLVVGNIPVLPFYHDGKLHWGSAFNKYQNCDGINPYRSFVRKRHLKKLHQRGQQMFVWTVNEEKDIKKLLELGVDGIITNYPDRVLQLRGGVKL